MTPYGYIYITTNLINGKKYIGQHARSKFTESYKGSGIQLRSAIKKYGIKHFKTTLIQYCYSKEELDEREIYWISYYNAVESDEFYNIARGGVSPTKGIPRSEETKRKISEKNKGRKRTEEERLRIIAMNLGRKCSEETRRKISEKNKGKHHSEETKRRLSEMKRGKPSKNKGKPFSEEHKIKLSQNHADFKGEKNPIYKKVCLHKNNKNKYVDSSDVNKFLSEGWIIGTWVVNNMLGKSHSEESKRKMSEKKKGKNNGFWGKHHTEEAKLKMVQNHANIKGENNPMFGRIRITNGVTNKSVYEFELEQYLSNGWKKGMVKRGFNV